MSIKLISNMKNYQSKSLYISSMTSYLWYYQKIWLELQYRFMKLKSPKKISEYDKNKSKPAAFAKLVYNKVIVQRSGGFEFWSIWQTIIHNHTSIHICMNFYVQIRVSVCYCSPLGVRSALFWDIWMIYISQLLHK